MRQDVSALEGGDRAGLGARWAFCLPAGCSTCWPWPASLREAGCPCFLCMLVCFAMGCFALWSSGGIHACLERGRLLAAERGVPLALGEKNIYLLRLNIQIWGLGISQVLLSDTRILDVLLHNSDRHHGAPGGVAGRRTSRSPARRPRSSACPAGSALRRGRRAGEEGWLLPGRLPALGCPDWALLGASYRFSALPPLIGAGRRRP